MLKVNFGKVNVNGKIFEKDEYITEKISKDEETRLKYLGFVVEEIEVEKSENSEYENLKKDAEEDESTNIPETDNIPELSEETENNEAAENEEQHVIEEAEILKMDKNNLKKLAKENNIDISGLNVKEIKEKLVNELVKGPNTSL